MVETLGEYIQSDLTAQQLSDLVERLDKARISPIRSAEGDLIVGADHYEFFPEEASLWEIVERAYCKK